MVRAAAKNHPSVAVVTSPGARTPRCSPPCAAGGFTLAQRARAGRGGVRAHRHLRRRRGLVDGQRRGTRPTRAPGSRPGSARRGTGPPSCATARTRTSAAALYTTAHWPGGLAPAEQLHGKEMSYNNYVDADAACRAAYDFAEPAVAIIKHANPCGIADRRRHRRGPPRAHECDPVSAFGGVIAANRPVTAAMAAQVAEVFTEVIVAPGYDADALELLHGEEEHAAPAWRARSRPAPVPRSARSAAGCCMQVARPHRRRRRRPRRPGRWRCGEPADAATLADLEFAWRACRSVKSNAILLASDGAAVGIGMGQVNRVDSAPARGGARGRGAGAGVGGRLRRVLPVPRRARRC